jgi:hypothetical protein
MSGTLGGYQLVTPVSDQQARPTINYKNGTITQMGPQNFLVKWTDKNGAAQSVAVYTLYDAEAWLDSIAAQIGSSTWLPASSTLSNSYQSVLYTRSGLGITAEVGFDGLYYWTDWIDGGGQEQKIRMNDLASARSAVDILTTQPSVAQNVTNYITSIPQQVTSNVQQTASNVATQTANTISGAVGSTLDKYGLYLIIIIVVFLGLSFFMNRRGVNNGQ